MKKQLDIFAIEKKIVKELDELGVSSIRVDGLFDVIDLYELIHVIVLKDDFKEIEITELDTKETIYYLWEQVKTIVPNFKINLKVVE